MDKNKNILIIFIILFASLVLLTSKSNIAIAGENVTVYVNVTSFSEITVSPTFLNWTSIIPGTTGGLKNVSIQNTGSENVTNLYGYVTTLENETARPYGSSDANAYSASGVMVFRNSTNNTYYWAGRLEWNWTSKIPNTDWSSLNPNGVRSEGFFRNTSVQFYWAVENGTNLGLDGLTNDTCNNTNARFAIEDEVDSGFVSTRTPDPTGITRNGGDSEYSYFSVNRVSSFLNGYCVAISKDCQKMYVYKFDKRSSGFNGSTCLNSQYISTGPIVPNEIEKVTADVWVPKGIPQGNLIPARWSFVAT